MKCKFCGNPVVVLGNCCESCGIYRGFIPRKAEELSKDERSKYGLWAEGKGYISYSPRKEDFEGIAEEISTEYPDIKVEIRSLQDILCTVSDRAFLRAEILVESLRRKMAV